MKKKTLCNSILVTYIVNDEETSMSVMDDSSPSFSTFLQPKIMEQL